MKRFATRISLAIFSMLLAVMGFAQSDAKSVDVNIKTDSGAGDFWGSPWVWVIGVAVFILLLVALMRPARRSDV